MLELGLIYSIHSLMGLPSGPSNILSQVRGLLGQKKKCVGRTKKKERPPAREAEGGRKVRPFLPKIPAAEANPRWRKRGPPLPAKSSSSRLPDRHFPPSTPEIRPPPAEMQAAASWSKGLPGLRSHLCAAASFHSTPPSPAKWKGKFDCKVRPPESPSFLISSESFHDLVGFCLSSYVLWMLVVNQWMENTRSNLATVR